MEEFEAENNKTVKQRKKKREKTRISNKTINKRQEGMEEKLNKN